MLMNCNSLICLIAYHWFGNHSSILPNAYSLYHLTSPLLSFLIPLISLSFPSIHDSFKLSHFSLYGISAGSYLKTLIRSFLFAFFASLCPVLFYPSFLAFLFKCSFGFIRIECLLLLFVRYFNS